MAKMSPKKAGRGAALITLLSNPLVRRAVIKGATQAANSASAFIASRSEKKAPASNSDRGTSPANKPVYVESETKVVSPNPTNPASSAKSGGSAKPSSFADSAAVESIVSTIASAAKPAAEKLAATDAGRSVLKAINSISGQALGSESGTPKRAGSTVASFVGSILAGQAAQKPQSSSSQTSSAQAPKFEPVKPTAPADSPPVETMQWPPPKS